MQIDIGWVPTVVTEEEYNNARKYKENYVPYSIGYCGFCLSFGGKWFGGWRRDKEGKRDYVMEAYRNTIKQAPKLKDIRFEHCNYDELAIPPNSIIYCDPPYANTTKYKDVFNSELFWDWCRVKKLEGHSVFISEYSAPSDFKCVYEKEVNNSLTQNTGAKKGVECLFTL